MQKKGLIALFCLLSAICHLEAGIVDGIKDYFWGPTPKPPHAISILILHDQPGALLEVKGGKFSIFDPYTHQSLSPHAMGKRKYIQANRDGLKWGEEFLVHQIKIVPENGATTTLVDGVEYPGNIYVYDIGGGSLSIVNELSLEDYLMTTLIPQFKEPLSDEALAAIAIVARTNAYYQLENARSPYWSIDAKNIAYEGLTDGNTTSPMGLAVKATNRMVLTKSSSDKIEPLPTQWGSSTGGVTSKDKPEYARITIFEADQLAQKGSNAAQILSKAFPDTKIALLSNE